MEHIHIQEMAERIKQRRAGKGVREAAKEIGISPATLSRVENGKIPDLETFGRVCSWLGDDPAIYLGIKPTGNSITSARVHFKKEEAINPETARALSEMILLAHKALEEQEEVQG